MTLMFNGPLLNICIPYYNASKWIEEALTSLKNQNYKNYVVHILNDGSTKDETKKLEKIIEKAGLHVNLINHKHKGLLYSRYYMFKSIGSGIVVSLDADDYFISSDALYLIAKEFQSKNCDAVFFNYCRDNKYDKKILEFDEGDDINQAANLFFCTNQFNSWCLKAFKTDFLDLEFLKKYSDVTVGEDRIGTVKLFKKNLRVSIINDALYCYRITNNSILNNDFDLNVIRDQIKVEQYIKDFAQTNNIKLYKFEKYVNEFIVYSDIQLIKNSSKNYLTTKNKWIKLFDFLLTNQHIYNLDKRIKLHRKICLWLFYKRIWRLLYLLTSLINLIK